MIDVDLARNPRTAPRDVPAMATPGFWRMEVRTAPAAGNRPTVNDGMPSGAINQPGPDRR
ncbi:hypothetical protein ACLMAL_24405 [Nocardia sp. CWNU-33]|uniref:hypothetical protein n=1 Tax=Nocardia sp. CWNU-33 TaxID=3392117 RepID=UPI00398E5AA2